MRVEITHTTALLPAAQFVQWTLRGPLEPGEHRFTVERAGVPEGPWEPVLVDAVSQYAVRDDLTTRPTTARYAPPNQLTFVGRIYYRVTALAPSGASAHDVCATGPSDPTPSPAALRMEQSRRHLAFQFRRSLRYTGTPVRVFKRRLWGARCPRCWDPRTKQIVRADCRACWSTGFEGGYWSPYDVHAVRSSLTAAVVPAVASGGGQRSEGSRARLILPDLPQLERDDLIVAVEDQRRFLVESQEQPEVRLRGVHQILACAELARDHVLYHLPAQPGVAAPLY